MHSDVERMKLVESIVLKQESRQALYIYCCHHKENKP